MAAGSLLPLELCRVSRVFGRAVALRDVDLTLAGGEVVGLLGPNGAGKTTLLRIAAGLDVPSRGVCTWCGDAARLDTVAGRGRLAFVAHTVQLYPLLTARENLALFARLRAAAGLASEPVDEWLARVGLGEHGDRLARTFSRGMLQRLALARALMTTPDLLLLDEPFTALDREGRVWLAGELRAQAARGAAVLLSSHDLDAVLEVTDRVLLLRAGRCVARIPRQAPESYRARVLDASGPATAPAPPG